MNVVIHHAWEVTVQRLEPQSLCEVCGVPLTTRRISRMLRYLSLGTVHALAQTAANMCLLNWMGSSSHGLFKTDIPKWIIPWLQLDVC